MPAHAAIGKLRSFLWKIQRILLFKRSPQQFAKQSLRMRVRRFVIKALHI